MNVVKKDVVVIQIIFSKRRWNVIDIEWATKLCGKRNTISAREKSFSYAARKLSKLR